MVAARERAQTATARASAGRRPAPCANRTPRYAELLAYDTPRSVAPLGSVADDAGASPTSRAGARLCVRRATAPALSVGRPDICAIMAPTPATDTALTPVEPTPDVHKRRRSHRPGTRAVRRTRGTRASSSRSATTPSCTTAGAPLFVHRLGVARPTSASAAGRAERRRAAAAVICHVGAWQAVAAPEGGCAWQPTLLLGADGGIHAFATTPGSGRLWEASWGRDGPPTTPLLGLPLGRGVGGAVGRARRRQPRPPFVRGPAGALFERAQTRGGGWGEWVALGGGAASSARPPSLAGAQT